MLLNTALKVNTLTLCVKKLVTIQTSNYDTMNAEVKVKSY